MFTCTNSIYEDSRANSQHISFRDDLKFFPQRPNIAI